MVIVTAADEKPHWAKVALHATWMGLVFGVAFSKSRVFEPELIRGQFLFQRWVMLKMFLGAMGSSALTLSLVPESTLVALRASWVASFASRGLMNSVALGAALLGAGMAISAACPGMVIVQVGSGVQHAEVTMAGGLLGALLYGLVEGPLARAFATKGYQLSAEWTLDQKLGLSPKILCAGLGLSCLGFAAALEALVPWVEDLPPASRNSVGCHWLTSCPAWPPSIAGALLGLLQLPATLSIGTFLGSATGYQVVSAYCAAPVLGGKDGPSRFEYLAQIVQQPDHTAWWQVYYAAFAMLSALGLALTQANFGTVPGVDVASAALGGVVMLFGARLAGGCTTGHGISGASLLIVHSHIAVPFMFAGGIVTAVLWNAITGPGAMDAGAFYPGK